MTIRNRSHEKKPVIDLSGPQGNAWCLLGYAVTLAEQLSLDGEAITAKMQTGDYEHLLQVFNKYFGEYVDLIRPSKEEED